MSKFGINSNQRQPAKIVTPPEMATTENSGMMQPMTEEELDLAAASNRELPPVDSDVPDDPSMMGAPNGDAETVTISLGGTSDPSIKTLERSPLMVTPKDVNAEINALKEVNVRVRQTVLKMRVPHPSGKGALWLNLVKGQEYRVPVYVRDILLKAQII